MLAGLAVLVLGLALGSIVQGMNGLLPLWFVLGLGYSAAQTPSGRLLRRSAHPEDRPAVYAAQFALSHACWLAFYPLAGWLGARAGLPLTFAVHCAAAIVALVLTLKLWPVDDPEVLEHEHHDLPPGHAHADGREPRTTGLRHTHPYVVDDLHPRWPGLER
jgi:MFS family permease